MNNLILLGFGSAFIIGPATSKLAAQSMKTKRIPWEGFSGLLVADIIYLGLAIALVTKAYQLPPLFTLILSICSGILFISYGFVLIFSRKLSQTQNNWSPANFKGIFKISILNFNLIAIYTGLLLQAKQHTNTDPSIAAFVYFVSFFFGSTLLFVLLDRFESSIKQYIRPIEITTGLFFISTSIIHLSRYL